MGIDVQLRSETGDVLDSVDDGQMILSRATRQAFAGTNLLRYLEPWGDAMFNQAQSGDLMADIRLIKETNPNTPLADLLSKVEPLVDRLSRETHTYLWFVGD